MTRFFLFFTFITLLFSSSFSTAIDFSTYSNSTAEAEIPINKEAPAEFLKVDQAFQFHSVSTPEGLKLTWTIADDYYLYLERFKFKALGEGATLGEPQYSTTGKSKQDPYFGEVHVIHNYVQVMLPVQFVDGDINDAEIKISYQGCAEAGLCYPPKHQNVLFMQNAPSLEKQVNSENAKDPADNAQAMQLDNASGVFSFLQNSSLPLIIGIFFLLGLGLTFTPCVFPMIPIITGIIAGQENPTARKSFLLSLTYVVGMAATYSAAGVVTGLLGASANIQAALQDPYLLSIFAAIFFLLALSMFGLYELQLPSFIRDRLNNTSQNLNGGHITSVFLIGSLSALIVSPCVSAPLAGALLYISSTADAVIGGASLFSLGIGMGVPLIIIAVGGGKLFPKAGMWMEQVKYFFGIMLVAVGIWLLSRFIPGPATLGLWAILIGITAVQMGAFDAANSGWPRTVKGFGILLALYSALLLLGALSGGSNPLKPLDKLSTTASSNVSGSHPTQKASFKVVKSIDELQQALEIAKPLNKPAMVDFYADWCISCKVMEDTVFPQQNIKSKMDQFYLIKADVTENNLENKDLLNMFGLFGPPSILFFDRKGEEITSLRIVGEISENGFEKILTKALTRS